MFEGTDSGSVSSLDITKTHIFFENLSTLGKFKVKTPPPPLDIHTCQYRGGVVRILNRMAHY